MGGVGSYEDILGAELPITEREKEYVPPSEYIYEDIPENIEPFTGGYQRQRGKELPGPVLQSDMYWQARKRDPIVDREGPVYIPPEDDVVVDREGPVYIPPEPTVRKKGVRKGKVKTKPLPKPGWPELGMAEKKEGYSWGIQPTTDQTSWWKKWFLGKGTPSKIPYVIPFAMAIAGMDKGVNMGPAFAVWGSMRKAGQAKLEKDFEHAKEILQMVRNGVPVSPDARKTMMKYWPTMGQKKYSQVTVQYRQNPKTGEWVEEDQSFRKYGRSVASGWKNDSRMESKQDWVMQPQSEAFKTMQAYDTLQKTRTLAWREHEKSLLPGERKNKAKVERQRREFMSTGSLPEMQWEVVNGILIGWDKTGHIESKFKIGPSQEELIALRAKHQGTIQLSVAAAKEQWDYNPKNIRKTYRDAGREIVASLNEKIATYKDRVKLMVGRLGRIEDTESILASQALEGIFDQLRKATAEELLALHLEFTEVLEDPKYKGMAVKRIELPGIAEPVRKEAVSAAAKRQGVTRAYQELGLQ